MSEHDKAFLELLRARFGEDMFAPADVLEDVRMSQLPESIRAYVVLHGLGVGASKAVARWLAAAGATRLPTRGNRGFFWTLP